MGKISPHRLLCPNCALDARILIGDFMALVSCGGQNGPQKPRTAVGLGSPDSAWPQSESGHLIETPFERTGDPGGPYFVLRLSWRSLRRPGTSRNAGRAVVQSAGVEQAVCYFAESRSSSGATSVAKKMACQGVQVDLGAPGC